MTAPGTADLAFQRSHTKEGGVYDREEMSAQALSEKLDLIAGATGPGGVLWMSRSGGGNGERGTIKTLRLSFTNRETGNPVPAVDIDTSMMLATPYNKDSGAGYSNAGLSQPAIVVGLGMVTIDLALLNAEVAAGDSYRYDPQGIKVTIDALVITVPVDPWSGGISEVGDTVSVINSIDVNGTAGFNSVDGKQDDAKVILDKLDAWPDQLALAAKIDQDIFTTENEITSGGAHTALRDQVVRAEITADDLVAGAAVYTVRFEVTRGALVFDLGPDFVAKDASHTAIKSDGEVVLKLDDVLKAFIQSNAAGDTTTPNINLRVFEVG